MNRSKSKKVTESWCKCDGWGKCSRYWVHLALV